jgi:hypothetical protein
MIVEAGEALAAGLRAELRRLGLGAVRAEYVAGPDLIRLSWPHGVVGSVEESVEVAATREQVAWLTEWLRRTAETFPEAARGAPADEA